MTDVPDNRPYQMPEFKQIEDVHKIIVFFNTSTFLNIQYIKNAITNGNYPQQNNLSQMSSVCLFASLSVCMFVTSIYS